MTTPNGEIGDLISEMPLEITGEPVEGGIDAFKKCGGDQAWNPNGDIFCCNIGGGETNIDWRCI
jgi:hypothetical protein